MGGKGGNLKREEKEERIVDRNREANRKKTIVKEKEILGDGLLVNLKNVDGHTTGGRELLVANMALEVLGFLVLHKDLLVIEFPVAIVTPYL